jgi:RNA polymerase sigma-70 factor (ECF subfamily)
VNEAELIEAARTGDGHAFAALLEPYRAELHAHCRRMLRSDHDAEDMLQEVMLRAWRALRRFEGRASLRSWLHRIATNACLNEVDSRGRRPPTTDAEPPDEGHEPDERESLEEALTAAHERLPAGQRAALLLRDGFGFTARESAALLGTTTVSVNSALQRARVSIAAPRDAAAPDPRTARTVRLYMEAVEHDDIERFIKMLRTDAAPVGRVSRRWRRTGSGGAVRGVGAGSVA